MREAIRRWLATLGGSPALPLTLDRRRIFVLPTGPGLAFGCALLAMLLTAINYTLSLGFALVFMLAGLGQVALLHAFRNLYALKLRETVPEPVFAGQHASFPLWLDNDASRPRPALQLAMRALTGISSIVGYQHLQGFGPVEDRLVVLRRGIVTTFLLTTDYLQLEEPRTSAVSFYGENPCGNPFAAFDWRGDPAA